MGKSKGIKDMAFILGFDDRSNNIGFYVYKFIFDMRKVKRIERKDGKFATVYVIDKRRSLDDYLTDELRKHDLELVETHISKCKKHRAFVHEDRKTNEIYDYINYLVFENRQAYEDFKIKGKGGSVLNSL
jgi:hypothetical protein